MLIFDSHASSPWVRKGDIVVVSSEQKDGDPIPENEVFKKYPLKNCIDNNVETCWVFEPDKNYSSKTIGLKFFFDVPREVDGFTLINGYAKSENVYYANNRITKFKVIIGQKEYDFSCENTLDYQIFSFPAQTTSLLTFVVEDFEEGNKYNDFCISEISPMYSNLLLMNNNMGIINGGIRMYESDKIYCEGDVIDLNEINWTDGLTRPVVNTVYRYALYEGLGGYCSKLIIDLKNGRTIIFNDGLLKGFCPSYFVADNIVIANKFDKMGEVNEDVFYQISLIDFTIVETEYIEPEQFDTAIDGW
jgi:hypothetical protein